MLKIPTTHFDKRGHEFPLFNDHMQCTRSEKGVLRGMHAEVGQTRWVTVALGEIYHVVVDLKSGEWQGWKMGDKKHEERLIQEGFAHGYLVLSETAIVISKTDCPSDPLKKRLFRYDDRDVAIDWPIEYPILSLQDEKAGRFDQVLDYRS